MTPQTLLSDLISKTCDPTDIVLIVIGSYAVAMRHNRHGVDSIYR